MDNDCSPLAVFLNLADVAHFGQFKHGTVATVWLQMPVRLPIESDRYFILVGLFDGDPSPSGTSTRRKLSTLIESFYSSSLIHSAVRDFRWRKDDGITHLAVWVWRWPADLAAAN